MTDPYTDKIIEAMARAWCRQYGFNANWHGEWLDKFIEDNWQRYIPACRAALAAALGVMQEPDEEVVHFIRKVSWHEPAHERIADMCELGYHRAVASLRQRT